MASVLLNLPSLYWPSLKNNPSGREFWETGPRLPALVTSKSLGDTSNGVELVTMFLA